MAAAMAEEQPRDGVQDEQEAPASAEPPADSDVAAATSEHGDDDARAEGVAGSSKAPPLDEATRQAFAELDKDNDGTLTKEEMEAAIANMSDSSTVASHIDVDAIFQVRRCTLRFSLCDLGCAGRPWIPMVTARSP